MHSPCRYVHAGAGWRGRTGVSDVPRPGMTVRGGHRVRTDTQYVCPAYPSWEFDPHKIPCSGLDSRKPQLRASIESLPQFLRSLWAGCFIFPRPTLSSLTPPPCSLGSKVTQGGWAPPLGTRTLREAPVSHVPWTSASPAPTCHTGAELQPVCTGTVLLAVRDSNITCGGLACAATYTLLRSDTCSLDSTRPPTPAPTCPCSEGPCDGAT